MDPYRPLYVLLDAVEFEAKRLINQLPPQPNTQFNWMKVDVIVKAAIKLRYHDDSFFYYREGTTNMLIIGRRCCRRKLIAAIYESDLLRRESADQYLWRRIQLLYETPCPHAHPATTEPR